MKFLTAFPLFLVFTCEAQTRFSAGVGASAFLGDLGGNNGIGRTFLKDLQPSQVRPVVSFTVSRKAGEWTYGVTILRGGLRGADTTIKAGQGAEQWRRVRRFSFASPVTEIVAGGSRDFGAFVITGGVGAMHFLKGDETEKKYASVQPLIMYGAGVRAGNLLFIATSRLLFTDMIDGVSVRGNPKRNDSYVTASFIYVFERKRKPFGIECPRPP